MSSGTDNTLVLLREQLMRNRESLTLHGDSPVMVALRGSYEWNNKRLEEQIAELQSKQTSG